MGAEERRLPKVLISAAILALLLISTIPLRASSTTSSPWPMFRGNPMHTGRSPYVGPTSPSLKWKFTTGGAIYSSPSIGADGTIYVGSLDGYLYAITPDGTLKWRFQTGGWVESSPAIGSDGTIYVGSYDGYMYAINPDGSLKWRFNTYYHGLTSSPAISQDGIVYFGGSYCCVYALNPDGSLKWNFTTDAGVDSSPAIGIDGTVYVGSYGYSLYAINPDGSLRWKTMTPGSIYSSPAIGQDGTVLVGTLHPFLSGGDLLAVHNGNQKWDFGSTQPVESSPAVGADGTVYLENLDGSLYALNSDGSVKWKSNPGGFASPIVDATGTIFAADVGGGLLAVNSDGSVKWYFALGEVSQGLQTVSSSPSLGPDGTVYVGKTDGNLYAIGASQTTAFSSTAVSTTTSSSMSSMVVSASNVTSTCNGFAKVTNAILMLCGRPFSFVGTVDYDILAPYLGLPFGSWVVGVSDPVEKMTDAASFGIKAIRFSPELGDFNGISYVGNGSSATCVYCGHAFDAFWQVYSKDPDHRTFFQGMDKLVADAKKAGVYLMPTLSVCWDPCWGKLGGNTDFFKVNSTANLLWKGFVRALATHYRNETQILFWDLTGEGNNVVGGGGYNGNATAPSEIAEWANDTYSFLKGIDPNHLIAGGWNVPWSGYFAYYGGGLNAYSKVVSEYNNMTFFHALNARMDIATLHLYDGDIFNDENFIGANSVQDGLAKFVEHYVDYSRSVLKEPFFIDETGGQLWATSHEAMKIGYTPSAFVKYLLQDMVKYHMAGSNFWGWEEDLGPYYISPQETPEIANWFKHYSGLLAAVNNQTATSTTATSSATSISTTVTQSSSVTSTIQTSATQTLTQTSSSPTTGGGGIPEFPYQLIAAAVLTALVAVSYFLVRRHPHASLFLA